MAGIYIPLAVCMADEKVLYSLICHPVRVGDWHSAEP